MPVRVITVLFLVCMLFSCKWKTDEKVIIPEQESPVIRSLKDSSLPCFKCHSYENFSVSKQGEFSHSKHTGGEIHCNHCHIIRAHKKSSINRNACNKCHKLTNFSYEASGMPVSFSHQNHSKKYICSECHPKYFTMKKGTTKMTMEEMYKGKSCGKCHNGKIAFAATDCSKCHNMSDFKKIISYPSGGVSPAIFSHQVHAALSECSTCHTSIFKFRKGGSGMKMDQIYRGRFCGSCHNDQTAFGPMKCRNCHK